MLRPAAAPSEPRSMSNRLRALLCPLPANRQHLHACADGVSRPNVILTSRRISRARPSAICSSVLGVKRCWYGWAASNVMPKSMCIFNCTKEGHQTGGGEHAYLLFELANHTAGMPFSRGRKSCCITFSFISEQGITNNLQFKHWHGVNTKRVLCTCTFLTAI